MADKSKFYTVTRSQDSEGENLTIYTIDISNNVGLSWNTPGLITPGAYHLICGLIANTFDDAIPEIIKDINDRNVNSSIEIKKIVVYFDEHPNTAYPLN